MQLVAIEDLRMTDQNKGGGNAIFEVDNCQYKAELSFYLQGNECLGIHLGRHDKSMATKDLEEYLFAHKMEIRKQIKPEVSRLREEIRTKTSC